MSDPLRGFDPKGTYDAASLDYEGGSRDFWEQISSRTVALASPVPGESVLDAACGTGPSVVAAARAVGPDGHVLGIDYADQMLAIAQEKVTVAGLANVELRAGDMTDLELSPASFDVVLCVLGLFFVDDMNLVWCQGGLSGELVGGASRRPAGCRGRSGLGWGGHDRDEPLARGGGTLVGSHTGPVRLLGDVPGSADHSLHNPWGCEPVRLGQTPTGWGQAGRGSCLKTSRAT